MYKSRDDRAKPLNSRQLLFFYSCDTFILNIPFKYFASSKFKYLNWKITHQGFRFVQRTHEL